MAALLFHPRRHATKEMGMETEFKMLNGSGPLMEVSSLEDLELGT